MELFRQRLPEKPYCSDSFTFGLTIKAAQDAIKRQYIQPNLPWLKTWLVYDIDRDGAAHDWQWLDSCPTPNIIVENRENGHAHLFYGLEIPVAVGKFDDRKAARYAAAIDFAMMKKLGSDPGYTAFTAKNPLHAHWNVSVRQEYLYTLDWLADFLDLEHVDARTRAPDYGIGRNCTLFNITRRYAYKTVRTYYNDRKQGKAALYDDLQIKAYQANITKFPDNGLYRQEIDHIVKSVCNWTWKHFTPEIDAAWQAEQTRKASAARRLKADKKRQILFAFMDENPEATKKELAAHIGVSISTVKRYKRARKALSLERGGDPPPSSRQARGNR